MKAITAYLLMPVLFIALALNGLDGLVLCFCGEGSIAIEAACGDSSQCCDETSQAVTRSTHECSNCTDVPLNGIDSLSLASSRISSKVAHEWDAAIQLASSVTILQNIPIGSRSITSCETRFQSPAHSSVVIRI